MKVNVVDKDGQTQEMSFMYRLNGDKPTELYMSTAVSEDKLSGDM